MAAIERASSWLDAHNRQDMKAIDCYTEDIEIVEMPTGVVYKGMAKMRELPRMAYRRKGWKDLTHIIATETERVWSMSRELTCPSRSPRRRKRAASMESIYRKTKSSTASFTMPVRFICRFTETSFIMAEDSLAMD
jgi:hypothetical protein